MILIFVQDDLTIEKQVCYKDVFFLNWMSALMIRFLVKFYFA